MSQTPTFRTWTALRKRCLDPRSDQYPDYGGRGIRVCHRWLTFENFLADMGERPAGTTIDRIDHEGHYEPANCRWATAKVQGRNKRNNVLVTVQGRAMPLIEACERAGLGVSIVRMRISRGWSIETALSVPVLSHVESGRRSAEARKR
jgi:hypothetical protein